MQSSVTELDAFTERIAGWVRAALDRDPPTFGALLQRLPGVDPGQVADCLSDIAGGSVARPRIRTQAASLLVEAQTPTAAAPPSTRPIPHPLDCYWPNDASTLRAMTRAVGRLTPAGETVIYLAWPNAFGDASPRLRDRRHLLLEHDATRADAHRTGHAWQQILALDVQRDELPVEQAQTIVADPPWYPQELKAFLWAAARLAKPGARVLLALPPIGTRPGIEHERRDVLDWAARCGLHPRDLGHGVLGYRTPPFERAALAARGVPGTPDDWRRGDLLVLEATLAALPVRPRVTAEIWHRANIGELPVRVRVDDVADPARRVRRDSLLESVIDGDVLPTVSRRSALRQRARIWTSRNRVYASSHPRLLAEVLDAAELGEPIDAAVVTALGRTATPDEHAAVMGALTHLRAVAGREHVEHGLSRASP